MERIFPITPTVCGRYIGRPIYAVHQDGTHYCGYLEEIRDGQLVINGYVQRTGPVQTFAAKKGSFKKTAKKAKTSAFFPGFGFNRFLLPLTTLTLLFALPFLASPFFLW